jgi:glycosyltransferase involved in cell wall biosynthesis
MSRNTLLIITPKQFGYHIDYVQYARLLTQRFQITYVCWDYGLEKRDTPNVEIVYLSRKGNIVKRNITFIQGVIRLINQNDFNYVFSNYFKGCSIIPILIKKGQNIHIDIRTGSVRKEKWKRTLENRFIKFEVSFYNSISVISQGLMNMLKLKKKTLVLPLGANRIQPAINLTEYIQLLYIGTFYNRNIHQTIEGLADFIKNNPNINIKYTIIGSGDKDSETLINNAIKKYSLENVVEQLGYVNHNLLDTYLQDAHVGISYVPITEYFQFQPATKTFEYLLAGMPVLATKTYENTKVISKSNGELIDDNPVSFSEGLNRLIQRISDFNSEEIQSSVEDYEWEKIVARMNDKIFI